jgi:hypothetical protein
MIFPRLYQNIKPLEPTILVYYLVTFEGELDFHLRKQDLSNLGSAKKATINIERNMSVASKVNPCESTKFV